MTDRVKPAAGLVAVRAVRTGPGGAAVLAGADGTLSVLFELSADPDRPGLEPAAAWAALLGYLRPGWGLRALLRAAGEPGLRRPYLAQLEAVLAGAPEGGAAPRAAGVRRALAAALYEHWAALPPPTARRVLLELIVPAGEPALQEAAAVVPELLAAHGFGAVPVGPARALAWVRLILEPPAAEGPDALEPLLPGGEAPPAGAAAPAALELAPDGVLYPDGTGVFFLTVREEFTAGDPLRPLARLLALGAARLLGPGPGLYGVVVRAESPEGAVRSFRARRALAEGLLNALSEKLGRSWSTADVHRARALDAAESAVALGTPAYRIELIWAFSGPADRARAARQEAEGRLRAAGALPQTFAYIPERALFRLQPGGGLAGMVAPIRALLSEAAGLLPTPEAQPPVPRAPVALGFHAGLGRDVYFSFRDGFEAAPAAAGPAHGLVLILGEMGSGKTTLLRSILLQRLLQGRAAVVLDPEGEQSGLCRALGGRVIPALPPDDPGTCLCRPLQGEDPEELLLAARFLSAAVLEADGAAAGEAAVSALHGAVRLIVGRREPDPDGVYRLGVRELSEALRAVGGSTGDRRAATLAAALEPFAEGGILAGYFDRPRAVFDPAAGFAPGELLSIDLSGLREENRTLVYAALAWLFYRAGATGPARAGGAPLDVYIDEGWRLLRPGPFRSLLDELSRRARKRGIGIVLSTHLPADLLQGGGGAFSLFAAALVGRLGREAAEGFLYGAGFEAGRARELSGVVAALPRFTFLAVPGGASGAAGGRAFPVRVEVPPAWLGFFAEHAGAFRGGPD